MDFALTEEHKKIKETISKFVDEVIIPRASELDESHEFPMDIIQQLAAMNMLAPIVPTEYGGPGMDYVSYALIGEQVARGDLGIATDLGAHCSLCVSPILYYGTEEQKKKYLPDLCAGKKLGALALTEPNAGSDAAGVQTKAEDKGDYYLINGRKQWISNGDVADVIVVLAKTHPKKGILGLTPIIIEKGMEGFIVEGVSDMMGIHSSHQSDLVFEDLKVPKENVVGGEKGICRGFQIIIMDCLDNGRIGVGASSCGVATAALEETIDLVKVRREDGKRLRDEQHVQLKIAQMASRLNAARWLTYHAAWIKDQGKKVAKYAAMAKLFGSETCDFIVHECFKIQSDNGYIKGSNIERLVRDSRIQRIYEGTSEIQQLVISGEVLKRGVF
jgi:butyryl-CoA dehydrogenase